MATFAPRPNENADPWYGARETYDQSLEDAIAANEIALGGKLATADAPELIRDTMGTALVAGDNITITPDDGADTITIAAAGGFGALWEPGMYLTTDNAGPLFGVTAASVNMSTFLNLSPMDIPEPVSVDRYAINVAVAGSAGALARFGIFTMNMATGTATLVYDMGTVAFDATGIKTKDIAYTFDAPGRYWIGGVSSGGGFLTAMEATRGYGIAEASIGTGGGAVLRSYAFVGASTGYVAAGFPASRSGFSLAGTNRILRVGLRRAS